MNRVIKYIFISLLYVTTIQLCAQSKKPVYHPCFLMDSIDKNLNFIKLNAGRIFTDSFDCKQTLLDSIAIKYITTKNALYLDALSAIRQNPAAKVEDLYTDIIKRFLEDDFGAFLNQLYLAKGKFLPLQNELIATMNMIVNGKPLKEKYRGLLAVEIEKAKDKKDSYKVYYLEKLKIKIAEERFR